MFVSARALEGRYIQSCEVIFNYAQYSTPVPAGCFQFEYGGSRAICTLEPRMPRV